MIVATTYILGAMKRRISSEKEMQGFAQKLASKLKGGEVVELIGDVGAGKTTFVKGLAKGLGINESYQQPHLYHFADIS